MTLLEADMVITDKDSRKDKIHLLEENNIGTIVIQRSEFYE